MHKMRANPVMRLTNRVMASRARRKDGHVMGMDVLVLHTVGRKSGKPRDAVVTWFADDGGDGAGGPWLIAASANGADLNPDWYHNVKAHPDSLTIEIGDRGPVTVSADILEGAERDQAWNYMATALPRYRKYEAKTDRVIPVVRLARRTG